MTLLEKLAEMEKEPIMKAAVYCPSNPRYQFADIPNWCCRFVTSSPASDEQVCLKCWLREYKGGE